MDEPDHASSICINLLDRLLSGCKVETQEIAEVKNILAAVTPVKKRKRSLERYDSTIVRSLMQLGLDSADTSRAVPSVTLRTGNTPRQQVPHKLRMLLVRAANEWHFDPYQLTATTGGRPLSVLFLSLLEEAGLIDHLGLNPMKLQRFARSVEDAHLNNPYHNREHVCSVLQCMHMMMANGGAAKMIRDETGLVILSGYIAAACHDLGHPGVTNDFLIRGKNELALIYNDQSPSEHFHLTQTFKLLNEPKHDMLSELSEEAREFVRELVIQMVLKTDMKHHFDVLKVFADSAMQKQWTLRTNSVAMMQMLLKCADLSHTTMPIDKHRAWVDRLQQELLIQGDKEASHGLKSSPLTSKNECGLLKSQGAFFEVIVMPMYTLLCSICQGCAPLLQGAEINERFWADNN